MTYEEVVKKAKTAVKKIDTTSIPEHFAVEIDIEGEGAGALYIELDRGKAVAEPYDYYDNDCRIRTDADTFIKVLNGKLDGAKALQEGKIFFAGNWEKSVAIAQSLKFVKPAGKTATTKKAATTKKTTETKKAATTKKTTETKTAATTQKATAAKTAAKKTTEKKATAKTASDKKPASKKAVAKKKA